MSVHDGDTLVAEGRPATCCEEVPDPVPVDEVVAAQEAGRERWSAGHPFPTCVVCGPGRADGLGIFPPPSAGRDGLFGAAWTPDESTGDGDGCVRPEIVWAALDCPTSAPVGNWNAGPAIVLASLTARLGCPVRVGRAAHDPVLGARQGRAQGLGRRRAVRLERLPDLRLAGPVDRVEGVASAPMATHYRTCPFCEATCGLEIEVEGREVVSVRGDADDVFSRGFICPKAYGIKQLHEDPDRLTTPLVRRDGELVEAAWDEAFEEIDRRLSPILAEHGRNAVAVYLGNPNAHNLSALIHGPALLRALGTQQHLHGAHGRPDAEAGVGRPHVRHDAVASRSRTWTAATTC